MKKLLILAIALTVSGCGMFTRFVPVPPPPFPEPIKELTEKCPDLKQIEGNEVAITELLKTVVHNYNLYYLCSLKNDGWNDWYVKQRDIYESKLRKDVKK